MKGNIRSIYSSEYKLNLYELLKAYSSIVMKKDFQRINIPRLPVLTTEDGIKAIKRHFGNISKWKEMSSFIPNQYSTANLKKTGHAGIFAGALELSKEGNISIKQDKLFDKIFIKEN